MGKNDYSMYKNLVFITQIGINMFVPIFGGVLIGKWVSDKMGGNTFVFLGFIVLGVMVSFMEFYKLAIRSTKDNTYKKERK